MSKKGFCEKKFRSMLFTGTLTMAVVYFMLLCDTIIAGRFVGENGVAAINAVTPVTGVVTFAASIISAGTGILYSRAIGAMDKRRADKLFGQGMILSISVAVISSVALYLIRNAYFDLNGLSGQILEHAESYYRWTPVNAALSVMFAYVSEMVYTDGDESVNNAAYIIQITANIAVSIILVRLIGMAGIIIGTITGNALGLLTVVAHFFKKSNTLHFAWHFSIRDILKIIKFSFVDSSVYLCWGLADFILIIHVSSQYGDGGLVTLALIMNLIEFSVVLDGVGMAVQPLLGTYYGEKNNVMIKRLMREAVKFALLEGITANIVVFAFAKYYCRLFNISDASLLGSSIHAVQIVSIGMTFCSLVSLMTSYYMLVDHVGLSIAITVLKDGVLYTVLPIVASLTWGEAGMWTAFVISPIVALVLASAYVLLRYGYRRFPHLLRNSDNRIIILEDELTKENCAILSTKVSDIIVHHGYPKSTANSAALFTEEIGLTILEKNGKTKKPLLAEISLFFEKDSVVLIERDSGEIFDSTDPNLKVEGLSSFVLSGLMGAHKEKQYLTTTGYNRNLIRFANEQTEKAE